MEGKVKKMNVLKRIALITSLLILTTGVFSQSYDLRYRLKKGKEYRFYQETNMSIVQNLGFIEQELKNNFKGITRFKPVSYEGQNMVLSTCFETMAVNIESIIFSMHYDSSKPLAENDNIAVVYNQILNKDFIVVLTPMGKVVRIEGVDEIIDNAVNKVANITPASKEKLKNALKGHLGKETLKGNMEMLLGVYPGEKKNVGEKWNTSSHLNTVIKANLSNKWTFVDASANKWKLQGEGVVVTTGEKSRLNGMEMKQNINLELNQEDGWFISAKQTQNVKGTMQMGGSSQMPSDLEIPMTMKSTTILERR